MFGMRYDFELYFVNNSLGNIGMHINSLCPTVFYSKILDYIYVLFWKRFLLFLFYN